jgi:hypothetical protein
MIYGLCAKKNVSQVGFPVVAPGPAVWFVPHTVPPRSVAGGGGDDAFGSGVAAA